MKRDISTAVAAVLIVLGLSFALAKVGAGKPLTPSQPFTPKAAGTTKKVAANDRIVMRVNGEPITEREFAAFMTAVPEPQRDMFASPEGRRMLATEVVRMKALEQEGRRIGIADDPQLVAQFDLLRAQVTAQRALEKIVNDKAEAQVRAAYEKEKASSRALRHIVVAYEGSMVPPRDGKPVSEAAAMERAKAIAAKIRGGADFEQTARSESDDPETGARGGYVGPLRPGALPPELDAVVSKLQPGQVSDPVKTQFGIHVFSIGQPSLDDMRPQLLQRIQQQVAQEEVQRLEKAAKVDLDPSFFPPGVQQPAQKPPSVAPRSNG